MIGIVRAALIIALCGCSSSEPTRAADIAVHEVAPRPKLDVPALASTTGTMDPVAGAAIITLTGAPDEVAAQRAAIPERGPASAASPHVKRTKRLGLTSNDIGPTGLEARAESKRMPELIHVELGGNRIESPFETYGTDNMTGLVNRQGISLPEAGKRLEAKYGQLAWLHGPSQLALFPPGDSDL